MIRLLAVLVSGLLAAGCGETYRSGDRTGPAQRDVCAGQKTCSAHDANASDRYDDRGSRPQSHTEERRPDDFGRSDDYGRRDDSDYGAGHGDYDSVPCPSCASDSDPYPVY